ncbi:retrovirus-related pol polyprotein from transposon TNT 1-94 [Tanacetum coccineum]
MQVVQIVLWYLDSGCSKHMTGHRSQLINFVEKFLGTVIFGNDQIAKIMGYGDYQIGNVIISRVYYVKGLGHNLFSVGSKDTNLYTLSLDDMMRPTPICLLSKASKTKSWLWHQRLSHLNFATINELAKQGLVNGLPKLKYEKDHLCYACSLRKSKKHTHKPKSEDFFQEKLYLLHMDLCGTMRIESINGKKYILVIVDDYSRMGKGLLGPNGGSGGLIEGRFGESCGGNGGRGGSMSGVGEGKVDSMGGIGGGSLAIRLMVSNDGRGGRGLVVEGGIGAGGGEVNGGGVDLGVSKRLLLEDAGEIIGESGGIEVGEVGGGADT